MSEKNLDETAVFISDFVTLWSSVWASYQND